MSALDDARARLASIPDLQLLADEPLARHTRFGLGGPAALLASAATRDAFVAALRALREAGVPVAVIGRGTNLIASDEGLADGVVLRFDGAALGADGTRVRVEAGALLQDLVDFTAGRGLAGLHTMTGIPGCVGAAVYGSAGAYGRSLLEFIHTVDYFDGDEIRRIDNQSCAFRYRESIFKKHKEWLILAATVELEPGDPAALAARAAEIAAMRNAKYPPDMLCAGSIFKNCLCDELPAGVRAQVPPNLVQGGKVPSAWFLEQAGAKGLRHGGIQVADYHANLIYNAGGATAQEFVEVANHLKALVRRRFGIELEEEVQYLGFPAALPGVDQLESTPVALQALLAGCGEREMLWKPAPERWSLAEVLAHLADTEENCYGPRLPLFREEILAEIAGFEPTTISAPAADSLARFLRARKRHVALLRRTSGAAAVARARHESIGIYTFAQQLNEWAFHDLGHLRQIAELVRAVKYWPAMGPFQARNTIEA
jgi:UDP-N-acetylmuramate dehydrogenase